jgi:hypothetical protein
MSLLYACHPLRKQHIQKTEFPEDTTWRITVHDSERLYEVRFVLGNTEV